jgi:hypothetical protein
MVRWRPKVWHLQWRHSKVVSLSVCLNPKSSIQTGRNNFLNLKKNFRPRILKAYVWSTYHNHEFIASLTLTVLALKLKRTFVATKQNALSAQLGFCFLFLLPTSSWCDQIPISWNWNYPEWKKIIFRLYFKGGDWSRYNFFWQKSLQRVNSL